MFQRADVHYREGEPNQEPNLGQLTQLRLLDTLEIERLEAST